MVQSAVGTHGRTGIHDFDDPIAQHAPGAKYRHRESGEVVLEVISSTVDSIPIKSLSVQVEVAKTAEKARQLIEKA